MADIKDLKKRAEAIRDERAPGANTAERIGKWNLDAAELIGELKSFIDQFIEKKIKIDYNDLENKPLIWEMIPAGAEYLDENGDPIMIPIVRLPDNTPIDLRDIYDVAFSETMQKLDDILEGKVSTEDLAKLLAGKEDKLVSGRSIKTINGQSIVGSGNITIQGGTSDYNKLENKPLVKNIFGEKGGYAIAYEDGETEYQHPFIDFGVPSAVRFGETNLEKILDDKATHDEVKDLKNAIDEVYQHKIEDLETIRSGANKGATAVQPVEGKGLSTNDYTDADKAKLSELETAVGKKYEKPTDGIPSTDLASSVQTSISRADDIYNDYINAQNIL